MNDMIPVATISSDASLNALFAMVLAEPGRTLALAAEIDVPVMEMTEEHFRQLDAVRPQLILIDVGEDPSIGIRLAQVLADRIPGARFAAAGPALPPELLLEAMRAGVTEYLRKPVTRDALAFAVDRIARKLGAAADGAGREPGSVLAFMGAKGGVGTTTLASNLAVRLHQHTGRKTLLVDLHLELGDAALFLGIQPRFHLVDLVRNFHRMDADLLSSYVETHKSGVHLLSGPDQPENVESVTGADIRQLLHFLRKHYDYVVVDTPTSFSPPNVAAFEQAELIFLVSEVDVPSLRNIKRSLPVLDRITGGRARERVRLLINRFDARGDGILPSDAERMLGLKVFGRISNDYETVIRSINNGEPLILNGKRSAVDTDLRKLADELAGPAASTVAAVRPTRAGLGSRFMQAFVRPPQGQRVI
jgi:pilus assembly protein CpaE